MPGKLDKEILATLKALDERIKGVEDKTTNISIPTKDTPTVSTTLPKPVTPPVPVIEETYPVPTEYRTIVNQMLNQKFGIKIEPMTDRPSFMFTIVVPKEYSNMPENAYKDAGADLRTRVISYGEGIHGVRAWVERVAGNLSPEIKAKIAADRI